MIEMKQSERDHRHLQCVAMKASSRAHFYLTPPLFCTKTHFTKVTTETELIVHSAEATQSPPYNYVLLLPHATRSLNSDLCTTPRYWIMTTSDVYDNGVAATP